MYVLQKKDISADFATINAVGIQITGLTAHQCVTAINTMPHPFHCSRDVIQWQILAGIFSWYLWTGHEFPCKKIPEKPGAGSPRFCALKNGCLFN
jgi:hypothetical protein